MSRTKLADCTPDQLVARMGGASFKNSDLGYQTVKNARAQLRRITGLDNDDIGHLVTSGLTYAEWLEEQNRPEQEEASASSVPDVPRTKLTGLSRNNVEALRLVFDEGIETTASTATIIGKPEHVQREVERFMGRQSDHRNHPYASLHAVVRKLRKLSEATDDSAGPEAPPEALVVTESQEEATTTPSLEDDAAEIAADHPIKAKLDAEIAQTQADLDRLERDMEGVQADYDKAWAKERRYEFDNVPAKVRQESDRLSNLVVSILEQQKSLRERIVRLSNPAELLRRMQDANATTERIGKLMATKPTTKKTTARDQGFPEVYLGENGNFKPGLDASAKSDLIASAMGKKGKRHTFSEEEAKRLIKARNWQSFLNRKIEIEANAAKAKNGSKSKATAKAAVEAEVKPDPKPASKPRSSRTRKVGA